MKFSDIYGHENVKDLLSNSITENRVGHAYIFEGKRGIGRLSTAKAFANLLVCDNPTDKATACGACQACFMSFAGSHPDIRVITNTLYDPSRKESQSVLVGTIRQMKNEIYIKPYSAERKIYIIPMADTMTSEAQNSLLKVLEEPPLYCTIILIAENSSMFLPTILSRAAVIKFFPLDSGKIMRYLKEKVNGKSSTELEIISQMSGGSIQTALELLNDETVIETRNTIINHLLSLAQPKCDAAYKFIMYAKRNKKQSGIILNTIASFFRDLMVVRQYDGTKNITNMDVLSSLENFSQNVTDRKLTKILDIYFKYLRMIEGNANYPAAVECLILGSWEAIHGRNYRS